MIFKVKWRAFWETRVGGRGEGGAGGGRCHALRRREKRRGKEGPVVLPNADAGVGGAEVDTDSEALRHVRTIE